MAKKLIFFCKSATATAWSESRQTLEKLAKGGGWGGVFTKVDTTKTVSVINYNRWMNICKCYIFLSASITSKDVSAIPAMLGEVFSYNFLSDQKFVSRRIFIFNKGYTGKEVILKQYKCSYRHVRFLTEILLELAFTPNHCIDDSIQFSVLDDFKVTSFNFTGTLILST